MSHYNAHPDRDNLDFNCAITATTMDLCKVRFEPKANDAIPLKPKRLRPSHRVIDERLA